MIPKVQSMVRRSATECRDHYTVPLPGRFICTKCVVFIVICLWLFLPLCRDSINELAGSLKFPLKKLFVIDGSKRSEHSNAYMWVSLPLFRRLSSHRKHCLDFVWLFVTWQYNLYNLWQFLFQDRVILWYLNMSASHPSLSLAWSFKMNTMSHHLFLNHHWKTSIDSVQLNQSMVVVYILSPHHTVAYGTGE